METRPVPSPEQPGALSDRNGDNSLGVPESSYNVMICLTFQHSDSPSPNLSAKNGVLDNGRYHEYGMLKCP